MKRNILQTVLLTLLSTLLFSCRNSGKNENNSSKNDVSIGQYYIPSAAEIPSFYLSLVQRTQTDSSVIFIAKSLQDVDTIGMQIEILKQIPAGITPEGVADEDNGFKQGAIKFTSLGGVSDHLVSAMSDLYKLPVGGGMTSIPLEPLVFSSNEKDVDLTKNGTYTFKVFLENQIGPEAEAFVVVDTYKRLFEFRAKDSTQYKTIVSAFKGE